MSRLIWSAQMLFYLSLFSVKMSLLTLYRKLLTGLGIYNKIWWGIVVFTSLVSHHRMDHLLACMSNWLTVSVRLP
jgi:hypothetical protein